MWESLRAHHATVQDRPILSLFDDATRADAFSVRVGDLLLDYSTLGGVPLATFAVNG